ncbi:MAG: hypothetical protein KDA52_20215, partial [Planctomycetaceae bacterium]|nr:hypothetical protein [Planctomycetaceae bacterium]
GSAVPPNSIHTVKRGQGQTSMMPNQLSWSNRRHSVAGVLLAAALLAAPRVHADDTDIAHQAYNILKNRCYKCHGEQVKIPSLFVLERDSLIADRGQDLVPYITPGDLENSMIWEYVEGDDPLMPLDGNITPEEQATLKQWIEEGAPFPLVGEEERSFISEEQIMKTIARHLFDENGNDRKFQRYFSIAHLHNNRTITDTELRLYRAAFSKAVNSLSRQPGIIVPDAIDEAETVFHIDLRDVGWQDLEVWDQVVRAYPYGLKPQSVDEIEQYEKLEELYGAVQFDGMPYIRADWFVVTATRPPLYHTLVDIPETLDDLLARLGIDVDENLKLGQARRGGMFESGVSTQNRLVEYHPSNNGAFWLSYDFLKNSGKSNLARFPLGPVGALDEEKFGLHAFEHDGGEIIFNLPNGLNGYMLVDAKGNRIDKGPVDIVWDTNTTGGSPEIINGISCMNCHKHGTIAFKDDIRAGVAVFDAEAQRKVQELYPESSEMDRLLEDAGRRFLSRLEQAIGGFLKVGEDAEKPITLFQEPISFVARRYDSNVDLEAAARELGFERKEELKNRLGGRRLVQLGLKPLVDQDGAIKRSFWDSRESGVSIFQEAASELARGTPVP